MPRIKKHGSFRIFIVSAFVLVCSYPCFSQTNILNDCIGKNNEGVKKLNAGNLKGALKDFTEALKIKPDYAIAFQNRAIVRNRMKQHKEALADYNLLMKINPDDVFYVSGRAATYEALKDYKSALADYDKLVDMDQSSRSFSLRKRAKVKRKLGDRAGAKSDMERADTIDADRTD